MDRCALERNQPLLYPSSLARTLWLVLVLVLEGKPSDVVELSGQLPGFQLR